MPATFDRERHQLLQRAGCTFVRAGKGSHQIWRSPITEFKIEAFHLFELMLRQLRHNVTAATMRVGFADEALTQPIESDDEHEVAMPRHLVDVLQ